MLEDTLKALCVPMKDMIFSQDSSSSLSPEIKREEAVKEEENVINLTLFDDEESQNPLPHLARMQNPRTQGSRQEPSIKIFDHEIEEPVVDPENLVFDYFFRDQSSMTVREALTRLTLPDIKEISKTMKVGKQDWRVSVFGNFIRYCSLTSLFRKKRSSMLCSIMQLASALCRPLPSTRGKPSRRVNQRTKVMGWCRLSCRSVRNRYAILMGWCKRNCRSLRTRRTCHK